MFAVVGLILAIAPFYIAWEMLAFSFELTLDVINRRRKRKAERQAQEHYVFKTGPSRARKRAANTGRDACPPLRSAAFRARPLPWRARATRVPWSKTAQLTIEGSPPCQCGCAPKRPVTRRPRLTHLPVCRWAPASLDT